MKLPYPNLQNEGLYTDKKASYSSRTVCKRKASAVLDLPLYFQTSVITYPITSPLPQIFPW
ncbi:hypothetical protein, partial [Escherichia coli]|uniref:hypothetical protein n=1 Tax=Escherichia coli TaxID=562 RepID=UPI0019D1965E